MIPYHMRMIRVIIDTATNQIIKLAADLSFRDGSLRSTVLAPTVFPTNKNVTGCCIGSDEGDTI